MKTIGLIGGMSWESTSEYYRIINEEIKKRMGNYNSAKCIINSVSFAEIRMCQRNEDWDKAARILTGAAKSLEAAGADFIIIGTNTIHIVFDQIQAGIQIPILHIADITVREVLARKIKTIGLLGTMYTMEGDFYKSRLQKHGIQVMIPDETDRVIINTVIYNELCLGRIINKSRSESKRIIAGLAEQGAEGIILGCTELGLLIKDEDSDVPLFDTTEIHAIGAVDFALE